MGGSVREAGVTLGFISRGGLVMCRMVSGGGSSLRLKSGTGGCVTPEGPDGVASSDHSSSSSANTNVSPRAEGRNKHIFLTKSSGERHHRTEDVAQTSGEVSYSSSHRRPRGLSSSFCNSCTWSRTDTSSESRSHSHSGPNRTLKTRADVTAPTILLFSFQLLVSRLTQ